MAQRRSPLHGVASLRQRNLAELVVVAEVVRIAVGNAAVAVAVVGQSNVVAWDLEVHKTVVVVEVMMAYHSIASAEEVPPVVVEELELMEEMGKILGEDFLSLVEEESILAEEPVKKRSIF